MAKNDVRLRDAQIVAVLPVPTGSKAGDVVPIGNAGLVGHCLTDAATSATLAAGTAAPGLKVADAASVELIGVHKSARLVVAGNVAVGAKVYRVTADGTYSGTASGNLFIGYALEGGTIATAREVALTNA